MPKSVNLASFWKLEACCQAVLPDRLLLVDKKLVEKAKIENATFWVICSQTVSPDRSLLIGQKLVENAKIEKFKCDFLSSFQTLWGPFFSLQSYQKLSFVS